MKKICIIFFLYCGIHPGEVNGTWLLCGYSNLAYNCINHHEGKEISFSVSLAPLKSNSTNHQAIIIINPLPYQRQHEVIVVPKKILGKEKSSLFPIIKKNGKIFITQTIDKNNDGAWDEILIEVSLNANASDTLQINWVTKDKLPAFAKMANVQLSLRSDNTTASPEIYKAVRPRGFIQNIAKPYYQMEGPGIENDKVAFRAFFDHRNGKDIYGKIVDEPVLEKVGVGAGWHQMQYWGKDILKVGNSLGAGALAVQQKNKIYPLADADGSSFQVLYEGPLQAAFKLDFKNWDVADGKKNGSETISITKGNFFYRNDIVLTLSNMQQLITGIANFGIDNVVYKNHNAAFSSISTYGKQADGTSTNLGLAIMFPADEYAANKTTDTTSAIPNTSYVALKPSAKKTIYFFACWQQTDRRFAAEKGFETYLRETADKLSHPIQIKMNNKN